MSAGIVRSARFEECALQKSMCAAHGMRKTHLWIEFAFAAVARRIRLHRVNVALQLKEALASPVDVANNPIQARLARIAKTMPSSRAGFPSFSLQLWSSRWDRYAQRIVGRLDKHPSR